MIRNHIHPTPDKDNDLYFDSIYWKYVSYNKIGNIIEKMTLNYRLFDNACTCVFAIIFVHQDIP